MKAIIIDDEENARITLAHMMKEYTPELILVGCYGSLSEAQFSLSDKKPDVLFLDIQMPQESGLNLWNYFPNPKFQVVFTTAFHQYAIQAVKLSALDYLLKPIDIEELINVVKKLAKQKEYNSIEERLEILEANLTHPSSESQIVLNTANTLVVIKIVDIVRCESENNYTHFFLQDGKRHTISKTLKEYESILPESKFLRVHQSHLINLTFIQKIHKGRKNLVEMSDGITVPLSNNKKEKLINRLMQNKQF